VQQAENERLSVKRFQVLGSQFCLKVQHPAQRDGSEQRLDRSGVQSGSFVKSHPCITQIASGSADVMALKTALPELLMNSGSPCNFCRLARCRIR
jgi:hypothetical protein